MLTLAECSNSSIRWKDMKKMVDLRIINDSDLQPKAGVVKEVGTAHQ